MDELRDRLLVHALENAVKHHGTPKAGAIIGAVMATGFSGPGRRRRSRWWAR